MTSTRHGPGADDATSSLDLFAVADAMRTLTDLAALTDGPPLDTLLSIAVDQVAGARWASVTVYRHGRFSTSAATHPAAARADEMQYRIGAGPCIDSVLEDALFVSADAALDPRWSRWGQDASAEVGVRSVLAQRLQLHEQTEVLAALNLYSDEPDAFDDHAVGVALILATHAAAVVSEALAAERASNLMRGLESNREIGVAMGILMHRYRLTREQAFDVLRVASQDTNRKLAHIAADVADTGTLEITRRTAERIPGLLVDLQDD